ncbi:mucoidy inhibitor MuiA family protein [Alsobacter sp. SYSU M60028]|uniref:Mucoidy inhibitor MuiA family protein n=1 Tax=Alsobacter ponti TaxID=2962936 RepID=A0ABT1LKZ4_9HYPH|nr:mucoidy inhibitor MuiA family protein [Alsobacter ponti]MCP8940923.1 mucoidy inhibitor MuiA family protein [Alsobacter ponti]
MIHRLAFGVALAAASAPAALAADLEATSSLDTVTVFPDGASLGRTAKVTVPQGASTIVLRGLSPFIDPSSVRVTGESEAGVAIASVDVRATPGDPRPAVNAALEARLEALKAERESLAGAIEAAETQKAAIRKFAEASPEKLSPESAPLPVEKWASAWEAVGQGLVKVNAALAELNLRAGRVDADIEALEKARPTTPPGGAPRRDIAISIEAMKGADLTLRVAYRVAQASWQPVYDVRLDTGSKERKPSLDLVRRARIVQRSGEDWTGVALSVSTVRAARGTAAPELDPLLVSFAEPPRPMAQAMQSAVVARKAAESERAINAAAPPPAPIEEIATTIEAGEFQASFAVPGRVDVGRDGTPKLVMLSRRTLAPELTVRAAPAVDETAYLEAAFVNEEEAALLPGEASLTRDGVHVGRGRIKLTAPGEKVSLGLGADDRVRVKRAPVRREAAESGWIGTTRSDLSDFRTTVRNMHDRPLRIVVTDRLPVSEDAAIAVETLPQTTAPTARDVDGKRGVLEWAWDYQPGEQKEIRLAWRLKWPGDKEIVTRPGWPQPVQR